MIEMTCSRCGANIGRTNNAELIDKMSKLHDMHCDAIVRTSNVVRLGGAS